MFVYLLFGHFVPEKHLSYLFIEYCLQHPQASQQQMNDDVILLVAQFLQNPSHPAPVNLKNLQIEFIQLWKSCYFRSQLILNAIIYLMFELSIFVLVF